MKRRTLLQWFASIAAMLPLERLRLFAQPRELTPEAIATLREIAATVIPASIGAAQIDDAADKFVAWTRGYREGVPLEHGYGHPRLRRSPASPVPTYIAQLGALDAAARAKGARWSALDLETRRALLDASLTKANIRDAAGAPVRTARRRRPDGALFPEQRGERRVLSRRHSSPGVPADRSHDEAS